MSKIKAIIVDDEPLARERIFAFLKDDEEIEVIAECKNGEEAVEKINKLKPNLIFLDIQMPKFSGFEVIAKLYQLPVIIFVTAFDKYAIKAFEINALDYLLKPFDKERFSDALKRAKEKLNSVNNSTIQQSIESLLKSYVPKINEYTERFVIKTSGKIFFVNTNEIDWFEADGNYIKLHVGKGTELIRETIKNLESKLDPKKFIRVHRSAIININSIKELVNWFSNDYKIKLKNGDEVITGKTYKSNINKLIK